MCLLNVGQMMDRDSAEVTGGENIDLALGCNP